MRREFSRPADCPIRRRTVPAEELISGLSNSTTGAVLGRASGAKHNTLHIEMRTGDSGRQACLRACNGCGKAVPGRDLEGQTLNEVQASKDQLRYSFPRREYVLIL
jgi:hypothetical protein